MAGQSLSEKRWNQMTIIVLGVSGLLENMQSTHQIKLLPKRDPCVFFIGVILLFQHPEMPFFIGAIAIISASWNVFYKVVIVIISSSRNAFFKGVITIISALWNVFAFVRDINGNWKRTLSKQSVNHATIKFRSLASLYSLTYNGFNLVV